MVGIGAGGRAGCSGAERYSVSCVGVGGGGDPGAGF